MTTLNRNAKIDAQRRKRGFKPASRAPLHAMTNRRAKQFKRLARRTL